MSSPKNERIRKPAQYIVPDLDAKIKARICVKCGSKATEFEDDISQKEFSISGLCQECQNEIF